MINNQSFHKEMKVFTTEERIGSEEIIGLSISVLGLQLRWMGEFLAVAAYKEEQEKLQETWVLVELFWKVKKKSN